MRTRRSDGATARRRGAIAVAAQAAIAVHPALVHAAVIHVPGDHATIQAGIDAARHGDEVVVAPGTYVETIDFGGKRITVRAAAPADVALTRPTVIDGGGAGPVVTCASDEGADTVLRGFVVTGGFRHDRGGGMLVDGAGPTVVGCTFRGNAVGNRGAAMFIEGGDPTVTACTFVGNAGRNGGAAFILDAVATFVDCSFIENTADEPLGVGGALLNLDSNVTLAGCTFARNSADQAAGAVFNEGGRVTVTACTFRGNAAGRFGGAMANSGVGPTVAGSLFCANAPDQISGPWTDDGGNLFLDECPGPVDRGASDRGPGRGVAETAGAVAGCETVDSG